MAKDKLIGLLNEALQMEYTDVFLYPRESEVLEDRDISKKFEEFGRMELRHADNLALQIIALDGKPKWDFTPLDTIKIIDDILYNHLEREQDAIKLYNNLIEVAEGEGEEQLKLVLKGIRAEEQGHLAEIKRLLEKMKK